MKIKQNGNTYNITSAPMIKQNGAVYRINTAYKKQNGNIYKIMDWGGTSAPDMGTIYPPAVFPTWYPYNELSELDPQTITLGYGDYTNTISFYPGHLTWQDIYDDYNRDWVFGGTDDETGETQYPYGASLFVIINNQLCSLIDDPSTIYNGDIQLGVTHNPIIIENYTWYDENGVAHEGGQLGPVKLTDLVMPYTQYGAG